MKKHTFGYVRPAKIQISLRIRTVWSESSHSALLASLWCKVSSDWQRRLLSDCAGVQADIRKYIFSRRGSDKCMCINPSAAKSDQ